ncbi:hypothetical protein [Spirosoma spitsbergense]|uniref:hypothetical protein n=1 Tax=Spirosoma spitsbergense TaxID=431554 RepID=UPI0003679D2B|nr:hypothetical protein [Spirosoma spitsbergense]
MEIAITIHLENPGKVIKITYSQADHNFQSFFLNKEENEAVLIFRKINNIHEKQSFKTEIYENVSYYTIMKDETILINQ